METFGHGRGSMSEAGEQALRQWAEQMANFNADSVFPDDPIDAIDGMLAHVEEDSVTLQKEVGRMRSDKHREKRAEDVDDS